MGRGERVRERTTPIPAVGGTEEKVLQDDEDEVPKHDLSTKDCFVERGDLAWGLVVVVGQAAEEQEPDNSYD